MVCSKLVPLADEMCGGLVQVTSAGDATDTNHILHQLTLSLSVVTQCHGLGGGVRVQSVGLADTSNFPL